MKRPHIVAASGLLQARGQTVLMVQVLWFGQPAEPVGGSSLPCPPGLDDEPPDRAFLQRRKALSRVAAAAALRRGSGPQIAGFYRLNRRVFSGAIRRS